MQVLLAGASGALGGPLVRQLIAAGHQVSGITRSSQGASRITQLGGSPIVVDVMDRHALLSAVDGKTFQAVIHELTALKKAPARHSDMAQTNALRTEGTAHLLEAAQATGARRFVTQSIVFGYGYADHGTTLLTEAIDQSAAKPHISETARDRHLWFGSRAAPRQNLRTGNFSHPCRPGVGAEPVEVHAPEKGSFLERIERWRRTRIAARSPSRSGCRVRLITNRAYGFHTANAALALIMLTLGPINHVLPHEQQHAPDP